MTVGISTRNGMIPLRCLSMKTTFWLSFSEVHNILWAVALGLLNDRLTAPGDSGQEGSVCTGGEDGPHASLHSQQKLELLYISR
jgi:hypothetical protein